MDKRTRMQRAVSIHHRKKKALALICSRRRQMRIKKTDPSHKKLVRYVSTCTGGLVALASTRRKSDFPTTTRANVTFITYSHNVGLCAIRLESSINMVMATRFRKCRGFFGHDIEHAHLDRERDIGPLAPSWARQFFYSTICCFRRSTFLAGPSFV